MNNKGFMMAEVIVVSAVVMVTLVGLYTSYNKIFSLYNQRLNYYDVATLYELANIRDNNINNILDSSNSNKIIEINGDFVYNLKIDKEENINNTINTAINTAGLNETFKEYLEYLSTSIDLNNMKITVKNVQVDVDNVLIMENCIDANNCKYAYLEVLNK